MKKLALFYFISYFFPSTVPLKKFPFCFYSTGIKPLGLARLVRRKTRRRFNLN